MPPPLKSSDRDYTILIPINNDANDHTNVYININTNTPQSSRFRFRFNSRLRPFPCKSLMRETLQREDTAVPIWIPYMGYGVAYGVGGRGYGKQPPEIYKINVWVHTMHLWCLRIQSQGWRGVYIRQENIPGETENLWMGGHGM